jgi:hypothetical protein
MKNKILKDLIDIFASLGFVYDPIVQFRLFIPNDSGYEEAGDMWEYNIINISDEFIRVESTGVAKADKRYGYVKMDYTLNISDITIHTKPLINNYGPVWSMLSKRPYLNEKIREMKLNNILFEL